MNGSQSTKNPDNSQITVCIGFASSTWKAPSFHQLTTTVEYLLHSPAHGDEIVLAEGYTAA